MIIEEMTMPEFVSGLEKTRTVFIPFGSTEEHGPHLPIFVAPPIPYGVCRSTSRHPGTISVGTGTLRALVIDIVTSLYRHGLRNFILLTGHAGGTHTATLIDAGEELLERFSDLRIAVLTEFMLAAKEGRGLIETPDDSHAGEIETSRIMHSHPQLVRGAADKEYPDFPMGILVRDKRKFWPGGVWGDPTKASAEKGRALEELVVNALDRFVTRLETWQE
jgi:creatinine amidohydrolase